jgi:hypothetical protein
MYIRVCIYMKRKCKNPSNGGATERFYLLSIACDSVDNKYQGNIYLPLEYGNIEKPLYLMAR